MKLEIDVNDITLSVKNTLSSEAFQQSLTNLFHQCLSSNDLKIYVDRQTKELVRECLKGKLEEVTKSQIIKVIEKHFNEETREVVIDKAVKELMKSNYYNN